MLGKLVVVAVGGEMGNGAALAIDLLFAMLNASLFTKLFSNDIDAVTDIGE